MSTNHPISTVKYGGIFKTTLIRNGKVIEEVEHHNSFMNEGLIYALNCAFASFLPGAPTPIPDFYIGLGTANRIPNVLDKADDTGSAGIHTVSNEFETYTVAGNGTNRPKWAPQALATRPATITLSDAGFEVSYDITADGTVYGAFIIDAILKDGSGDTASNTIVANTNFPSPRAVETNDVYKVGYILSAEVGV